MADLISGLSLIEGFSRFLPALLVLLVMYAVFEYTKVFGTNHTLNVLISFVISVIILLSEPISLALSTMAPWFVILIIFIVFVIVVFKSMGVSDSQIMSVFAEYKMVVWIIIFLCIGIGIVGLGNVFGQELLDSTQGYVLNADGTYTTPEGSIVRELPKGVDGGEYQSNVTSTLFHPTILSFVLIGLIAAFTVFFMTKS
jgi:hypothetical protein